VAGVVLGSGIALAAAGAATEIAHTYLRRHSTAAENQPPVGAG